MMKTMPLNLKTASALCAALAALSLTPFRAAATQPPVERTIEGVVQTVNSGSQLMTIQTHGKGSKVHTIAWKSRTHFQDATGHHVSNDILKTGTTVKVTYRSLLAGTSQAREISVR